MSVYNLGIVNSAYINQEEDEPKDHMHSHLFVNDVAGQGSNNVASLIMKTLESLGLLNDEQPGAEQNIIFDNFLGQKTNKQYWS